jgi:tRNA A-37 threonylcarbamoyl transferase component Bud32
LLADPSQFMRGGQSSASAEMRMLQRAQKRISSEYAMVGWNSREFDAPVFKNALSRHGLAAERFDQVRQIDLMVEAQKHFRKLGVARPFSLRSFSADVIEAVTKGMSDDERKAYLGKWNVSDAGKGEIHLKGKKLSGEDYWKALGDPSALKQLEKYGLRDVDLLPFIDEHLNLSAHALDPSVGANVELMKRMRAYKHADSANQYFSYELNKARAQHKEWERAHGRAAAYASNKLSGKVQLSGEEGLGASYFSKWLREGKGGFRVGDVAWMVYDEQLAKDLGMERPLLGAQITYKGTEHRFDFRSAGQREEYSALARRVAEDIGDERTLAEMDARMAEGLESWKQRIKARATKGDIDAAGAAKALGAVENISPPGLDDYVSEAVERTRQWAKLPTITRAAPYVAATVIGADVLASRDKVGPFWGFAGAGATYFMTSRMKTLPRVAAVGGAYALGRMIAGSLSKAHQGSLPGFEEQGEASIMRKQLTEFGSGFRGMKTLMGAKSPAIERILGGNLRRVTSLGDEIFEAEESVGIFSRLFQRIFSRNRRVKRIYRDKNIRLADPEVTNWAHKPEGEFSGPQLDMFNKMSEPYTKAGILQAAEVQAQKEAGTFYENLPVVRHESYSYKGLERSYAHPTMEFPAEEVREALATYAREKGIESPQIFWRNPGGGPPRFGSFGSQEFEVARSVTPRPQTMLTANDLQTEVSQRFISESLLGRASAQKEALLAHNTLAQEALARMEQRGLVTQRKARTIVTDYNAARQSSIDSQYRSKHPDLEGFVNIGTAGGSREINTDFGTGWDAARSIARSLGIKAKGKKVYDALAKSDEWITALKSAEKVKTLGAGGFGSADLMETTVRGRKFRFVRKTALEGKGHMLAEEVASLRAGAGSRAASVYKYDGGNQILMEYIEGQTLKDFIASGKVLKGSQARQLKKAIKHLHKKGVVHTDLNARNVMITNDGRIAYIDPSYKGRASSFAKRVGLGTSEESLLKVGMAQDNLQLKFLKALATPGKEKPWMKGAERVSRRLISVSNMALGIIPEKQFLAHPELKELAYMRGDYVASARNVLRRIGMPEGVVEELIPMVSKKVPPVTPKPAKAVTAATMATAAPPKPPPVTMATQGDRPGIMDQGVQMDALRAMAQRAQVNLNSQREGLHARAVRGLSETMNPMRQSRGMSAASGGSRDQSVSMATADLRGG